MDRHWDSNGAAAAPAAPTNSLGANVYPQGGAGASVPGPWWYHMITEELRAVIVAGGGTPARATLNQLATAIQTLVNAGPPNAAYLNAIQTFTKAQRSAVTALGTVSGTINIDFSLSNDFSMTLNNTGTLTFTNAVAGQSGTIVVNQDATGGRTLAYTGFKFYGGSTAAPVLTTTASAVDHLHYKIGPGGLVTLSIGKNSS